MKRGLFCIKCTSSEIPYNLINLPQHIVEMHLFDLKSCPEISVTIQARRMEIININAEIFNVKLLNNLAIFRDILLQYMKGEKFIGRGGRLLESQLDNIISYDICHISVKSIVHAEDPFFFEHNGFYQDGILAAINENIKNRRILKGGSSITTQLVKNILIGL